MKKLLIFFLLIFLLAPAFGAARKASPKKKKAAAITKAITKATVASPEAAPAVTFKDLKPADPAYPYIVRMVSEYKAISGYPDGTFRGNKTINRAEFSKVLTSAVDYREKSGRTVLAALSSTSDVKFKDLDAKHWAYPYVAALVTKYKLLTGYPDGTYKPNKTITRYETATVLVKMLKLFGVATPVLASGESALADVKSTHWALKDIQVLVKLGIMDVDKKKNFSGAREITRSEAAVSIAKLIELAEAKGGIGFEPGSRIEKAVQIPSKPQANISGGWGNVYENASGTNNWLGFNASATYGDTFSLWLLSGNYELSGKYGFSQIIYLVPGGGGGVNGGVNNENRYELELNTLYPVVDIWGISGKLLLGAKYINLSNQVAPTNFTGFNAGLVTAARIFGRNFLLRGFYSLPLARASVSPSVLGQPSQLFDYEASIDADLMSYPVLLGFSGETMTLTGGTSRYYNMFFARYFLM